MVFNNRGVETFKCKTKFYFIIKAIYKNVMNQAKI
jgi:hypothetical protein